MLRLALDKLGIEVRRSEQLPALVLFLHFFLVGAFQFTGKAVRQATYVETLGSANLPWVYFLVALLAYPTLRLYDVTSRGLGLARIVAWTSVVMALCMAGFYALYGTGATWVPVAFYLWISVASVLAVSHFWTFANHVFDTRQARRLFGFIGAGGLLGAVVGGQLARASAFAEPRVALLVGGFLAFLVALLLIVAVRWGWVTEHGGGEARAVAEAGVSGYQLVRNSPHLRLVALILALTVVVSQIVDLQFNWLVEQNTEGLEERLATFGSLLSFMGLAAFLFQLLVTPRIHRLFGVGAALRVLPSGVAMGSLLLLASGSWLTGWVLMVGVGLRLLENAVRYSLEQSSRELLFLPVPVDRRRPAKEFIDVVVQRCAKGVAALLLLSVTFGLVTPIQTGWFAFGLCLIWLVAVSAMRREYVSTLRRGLTERPGEDVAAQVGAYDVTTLEVLVESLGSSDSARVLSSLDLLEQQGRARLVPPLLLLHQEASVRRRVLEVLEAAERTDALHLIEQRIGDADPDVRAAAIGAVAALSGADRSSLMKERLRDPDPRVRAAAISCLAVPSPNGSEPEGPSPQEAVQAALQGLLQDEDPQTRAEAAKALGGIAEPDFQEVVVQLLYDSDPTVVRAAIESVSRRAEESQGGNPIYVPILISLLRDRRLKDPAREALIAFGESVVPALAFFMGDEGEQIWVRRALPHAIATFRTESARRALVSCLDDEDAFLRGKAIEALSEWDGWDGHRELIEQRIRDELSEYTRRLAQLGAVKGGKPVLLRGGRIEWIAERPTLLEQLLADRLTDHLRKVFDLLVLVHRRSDIRAASQGILEDDRTARARALELLDHAIDGSLRFDVLSALDDAPFEERLSKARRQSNTPAREERVLEQLVREGDGGDETREWLAAAALARAAKRRHEGVGPLVERLSTEATSELVRETAEWAVSHLAANIDRTYGRV